jgi:hypothetical protein
LAGSIRPDIDLEDSGQSVENGAAEVWIASHEPAHKSRGFASTSDSQRSQIAIQLNCDLTGPALLLMKVRIPMRKNDHVTGFERHFPSISDCAQVHNRPLRDDRSRHEALLGLECTRGFATRARRSRKDLRTPR